MLFLSLFYFSLLIMLLFLFSLSFPPFVHPVDPSIWSRVSRLYPVLVECVTCHNMEVRVALKETLGQFTDLLVGSTQPQSDTCL